MTDFLTEVEAAIPSLRRYALALTRDADAADDLVQDCLTRALDKRSLWRPTGPVRAWLFSILHNRFISDRRRDDRRSAHLSIDAAPEAVAIDDPVANVALAEVGRALDALSIEQKTALLLVGVEGLTYAEAAAALGTPVGTVMSRIARARRALARELAEGAPLARVK